jgi:rfaE bifunctional protein nucleotidyltransferase chain/domain
MGHSSLFTLDGAVEFATTARKKGKTVVTTNGVFDLLSLPHVRLLEHARAQGDVLIVGVNSDSSVRTLKGEGRPIIPAAERATIVASLRCVDTVFVFDDLDPRSWLPLIRPNVHVNSSEYGDSCVESDILREIGARLELVPRMTGATSTSDAIAKIKQS